MLPSCRSRGGGVLSGRTCDHLELQFPTRPISLYFHPQPHEKNGDQEDTAHLPSLVSWCPCHTCREETCPGLTSPLRYSSDSVKGKLSAASEGV